MFFAGGPVSFLLSSETATGTKQTEGGEPTFPVESGGSPPSASCVRST